MIFCESIAQMLWTYYFTKHYYKHHVWGNHKRNSSNNVVDFHMGILFPHHLVH